MPVLLLAGEPPPGVNELLGDLIRAIFKAYPWVAWIFIIGFFAYFVVSTIMMLRSDEGNAFFGIAHWKRGDRRIRELTEDLGELITANQALALLLLITRRSLVRHDSIRHDPGRVTNADGLQYLVDWVPRFSGFQIVDINKIVLWVPDGAGNLVVKVQSGLGAESARVIKVPINPPHPNEDTFAARAFRTGELQVCKNVDTDPRYHQLAQPPAHAYKSILAVPVYHGKTVVAAVTLDSLHEDAFGADEENQGKLFASLFGLFI